MKQRDWIVIGALTLGWIIFIGQPTALTTPVRELFARLATPLVKLGNLIPTVESRRQLARANTALATENELLKQQVRGAEETARENQRLLRLLELKGRVAQRTVAARVIGRDASNWWQSIQIDRGTSDGLTLDLPVVTAAGLVGKIIAAGKAESRVLLLVDPACQASGLLAESRVHGVVAGKPSAFSRRPQLLMSYVDRSADIQPGSVVLTSGLGGVFPKGLVIGTVWHAALEPQTGMYQEIEIEPAVDFRRLEEVIVILRQP